jgi:hypothetical protein
LNRNIWDSIRRISLLNLTHVYPPANKMEISKSALRKLPSYFPGTGLATPFVRYIIKGKQYGGATRRPTQGPVGEDLCGNIQTQNTWYREGIYTIHFLSSIRLIQITILMHSSNQPFYQHTNSDPNLSHH